jgi:hypothetical protein
MRNSSVWGNILKSWLAAALMIRRMPILECSAVVANLVLSTVEKRLMPTSLTVYVEGFSARAISLNAVHCLLNASWISLTSAPLAVAVYRFVLLGEQDDRFVWNWRPEVPAVYVWLVLMTILTTSSSLYVSPHYPVWPGFASEIGSSSGLVVFTFTNYWALRFIFVAPSTALDPVRVSIKRCWGASRGRFWYIFAASWLAPLPAFCAGFANAGAQGGRFITDLSFFAENIISASIGAILYLKFRSVEDSV